MSQSPNAGPASNLLDVSTDCVKVVALDGSLSGMNPEGMCLMEIDDFSTVAGRPWSDLWPERHRETIRAAVARALAGSVARFSADCPTAKGAPKHWDVIVSPVHNEAGNLSHLLSISRDVTREVHLAGERALVARELAHRIKNLLAVVDGIVGMTARTATDTKSFAESLRVRLGGLARSVAYIYQGADLAPTPTVARTLHGLLRELMEPYSIQSKANITIVGDDLPLSDEAITPLALVFNELATNALKYGALVLPNGTLSIATRRDGETFRLRWVEKSDGPVSVPSTGGFGATLMDRTIKLQFGGSLSRHWSEQGVDIEFAVPSAQLTTIRS